MMVVVMVVVVIVVMVGSVSPIGQPISRWGKAEW